jgi:hypothetical protein
MKKGKLKKILASSVMGIMALAMPFTLTGCEKDTDINVRINGEYIQWQEENADSWNNLIAIEEVKDLLNEVYQTDNVVWYSGTIEPTSDLGKSGDYYLNTSNMKLYIKVANGVWNHVANLSSSNKILGDVDENGVVNQQDAVYLLRYILNYDKNPLDNNINVDFNDDGLVDYNDALILQAYVNGTVYELPYTGKIPDNDYLTIVDVDYNEDNVVNHNDALYFLRHTLIESKYPIASTKLKDVNLDGYVTHEDVICFDYYVAGAIKYLPFIGELPTLLKGDLNLDNVVDLRDLHALKKHVSGQDVISFDFIIDNADFNDDGIVNLEDINILKDYINGEDITL